MINIIIKKFIKNYENIDDRFVRESYGVLAGILGIICNLFLFILKLSIGLFINSIAVISDAFNNLTDLGSSLISIISAKFSNRPPDTEHPYGHGRFEYISSLAVSFIILSVGLQLLHSSFKKIFNPEKVLFSPISIIILTLSVSIKLWMFSYNKYIGKTINSSINKATAYDSLNDAIATIAVIITMVIGIFIDIPIDGVVGVAISFLILYTGVSIAKDTVNLLLGTSPNQELIDEINSLITKGKYVVGTHDLKIHDYGPGRVIASIHAEVPDNVNIIEVHSIIDALEESIINELGINIVIHMDPISTDINKNRLIKNSITEIVKKIDTSFSIQNLRIVDGESKVTLIFDLLVPSSISKFDYEDITQSVIEHIKKENNKYNVIIHSIGLSDIASQK